MIYGIVVDTIVDSLPPRTTLSNQTIESQDFPSRILKGGYKIYFRHGGFCSTFHAIIPCVGTIPPRRRHRLPLISKRFTRDDEDGYADIANMSVWGEEGGKKEEAPCRNQYTADRRQMTRGEKRERGAACREGAEGAGLANSLVETGGNSI